MGKQRERHRCRTALARMKHLDCENALQRGQRKEKKEPGGWGGGNKMLIEGEKGGHSHTHVHVHGRACLIAATQCIFLSGGPAFVIHTQAQLSFLNQICPVFFPLASSFLFATRLSLFSPSSVN